MCVRVSFQICAAAADVLGDVCRAVKGAVKRHSDKYVDAILQDLMVRHARARDCVVCALTYRPVFLSIGPAEPEPEPRMQAAAAVCVR